MERPEIVVTALTGNEPVLAAPAVARAESKAEAVRPSAHPQGRLVPQVDGEPLVGAVGHRQAHRLGRAEGEFSST